MLKSIFGKLCMILMCLLCVGGISACCTPNDCEVKVIFSEVDENMGVSSYSETIKYGENFSVEFIVPEGYDHSTITAKVDEKEFDYSVEFLDDTLEESYQYSTQKTIRLTINKINRDFDLVFDMSEVRKKQFSVTMNDALRLIGKKDDDTNFKIVSVKPESVSNLTQLSSDVVTNVRKFVTNTVTVDYGEYIILCYTKQMGHSEIPTVYSDVGFFTDEEDIKTTSAIDYVSYDVATRGNTFYSMQENGIPNSSTRLFYMGKIQENINLYDAIPNLEIAKGFSIENKNIFTLLTNKQDYKSEMLDIKLFAPSSVSYSYSNDSLDKINNTTIQRIDKYSTGETLKNPTVVYEYLNRYDAYQLYVGNNIATDSLINQVQRNSLPSTLYLSVGTQDFLEEHLDISLLSYEKQNENDTITYDQLLTEYITSEKGEKFYKIDAEVLSEFLLDRAVDDGNGGVTPYNTGCCILYVAINPKYVDDTRLNHTFPYSSINYPIVYGTDSSGKINYDYEVSFYILNDDGSKDYGFLDLHKFDEDIVFFETSKLWAYEGGEWQCLNNLYVTISGPDYNDYYSPVIERVFMELNYDGNIFAGGVPVEDSKTFNGIKDLPVDISGLSDKPYSLNQYGIFITLSLTTLNVDSIRVDFGALEFTDQNNDAIFATNTAIFSNIAYFSQIYALNCAEQDDVRFGSNIDIFYIVLADTPLDFDIYVGQVEEGTDQYVGIKDEKRKISATKKLCDIAGNEVKVELYGKMYNVYVKYQNCDIYALQGTRHFAYNS